jgi:transcription elongation factor Elf1
MDYDNSETWRTDEVICPHCGHEYSDSWEFDGDTGNIECCECEKEFGYERNIEITYSTSKQLC